MTEIIYSSSKCADDSVVARYLTAQWPEHWQLKPEVWGWSLVMDKPLHIFT